jgi:hypothetical protein
LAISERRGEGRRYRKQPKIDALRQYKDEILEAHRSGLAVHRIAQILRERGVDISIPHLVRTIRRFIEEEERSGPASTSSVVKHQPSAGAAQAEARTAVAYKVYEQRSAIVQEERSR